MAAEASRSTTGPADSYIGSLISLTSKSEIRYEGVLFTINTEEASIGLRNVRSFGTEGRRGDGPQVPPSDKVYEYIVFRGSDIKDLQVKSSPPQTSSIHNDPAIIQSQYGQAPTNTSLPHVSSAAVLDASNRMSQGGHLSSPYQSNLPLYQAGGNVSSWGSAATPPTSGPMMHMYQQGFYGASNNLLSQQPPMLQPPQNLPMPFPVQQPAHSSILSTSIQAGMPVSQPMLLQPPGSGGFNFQPNMISGQSVTVPGDTSSSLLPAKTLAPVPLPMSQGLGLPFVSPVSDVSDMRAVNTITNQTKPASGPLASYSGMPEPVAASVRPSISPTLVTPGQLVQPGSAPAQFVQPGSAPAQFVQPGSAPAQFVQPGSGQHVQPGSGQHVQPGSGQHVQPGSGPSQRVQSGSGPGQHVQPGSDPSQLLLPGSGPGQFVQPGSGPAQFVQLGSATGQIVQPGSAPGQFLQPGSAPGQFVQPGSSPGPFLQPGSSPGPPGSAPLSVSQPLQTTTKGVEAVQVSSSVQKQPPAVSASPSVSAAAPKSTESQAPLLPLPSSANRPSPANRHPPANRPSPANRHSPANREFDRARSHSRYIHRGGRGRGRGSELSNSETRFTEDFDFEAMNEKFNKDEVWGHLGKTKAKVDDDEYPQYDENDVELPEFEAKPIYNKDDFFDSLSSNSVDNGSRNGRPRFSEQRKLDTETFGEFSRYRGGRGGRGTGYGRYNRGGYYGRGNGYGGRGRGHYNVYRAT